MQRTSRQPLLPSKLNGPIGTGNNLTNYIKLQLSKPEDERSLRFLTSQEPLNDGAVAVEPQHVQTFSLARSDVG